jgi:hypothetical protein
MATKLSNLSKFTAAEIRAELERREKRRPQGTKDSAALLVTPDRELETELVVRDGRRPSIGVDRGDGRHACYG